MTVLVAVLLACCGHLGAADDDKGQTKRTISLSPEAVEGAVKRGAVPKFRLTIRNTGKQPKQVLDVRDGRRRDLQHTYYDLEVTDGEKVVDLPRAISDPGPISDRDFVALKPGEAVTVHLSDFAPALERLPPGRYKARVRFWQDPYKSRKTSFLSPPAEFVVRE
jgi:hypothetical protein